MRKMGGGSPVVFPFPIKAPSVNISEEDPPIGKERGALGVGTGPTPPQAQLMRLNKDLT